MQGVALFTRAPAGRRGARPERLVRRDKFGSHALIMQMQPWMWGRVPRLRRLH